MSSPYVSLLALLLLTSTSRLSAQVLSGRTDPSKLTTTTVARNQPDRLVVGRVGMAEVVFYPPREDRKAFSLATASIVLYAKKHGPIAEEELDLTVTVRGAGDDFAEPRRAFLSFTLYRAASPFAPFEFERDRTLSIALNGLEPEQLELGADAPTNRGRGISQMARTGLSYDYFLRIASSTRIRMLIATIETELGSDMLGVFTDVRKAVERRDWKRDSKN